jgi:peptidoglycan lytic transglycosylase G
VSVPKERRLVSAVIHNRLRRGMPLGIDATLRYGLGIPPDESITQSDLESTNPYNTRVHEGLPPTPINNPGLAAMKAAAKPAGVDFLYYARKEDCESHFFTASFAEFETFLAGPRC